MNVLSESMKFGKLLNRVRNDGKVYLNYKDLKQCMGESTLFKEKLKREVRYVDTFFEREEASVVRARAEGDAEAGLLTVALQRFVVINCFAVLKIILKHDKQHGQELACHAEMVQHLRTTKFYNAFQNSPVFTSSSSSNLEMLHCVNCRRDSAYGCCLSSCHHPVCWACLIRLEEGGMSSCPACGDVLALSPSVILAEDILGVEPRALPRRERRKGKKKKELQEEGDGNILAESDDDRTAVQRSVRYYCKDCSMVLNSFRQAQIHTNGQRHLDQVQRLKERCAREGVPYEPTGLVHCGADTKIEGAPKPRRSRGGLRNRLKNERELQGTARQGEEEGGEAAQLVPAPESADPQPQQPEDNAPAPPQQPPVQQAGQSRQPPPALTGFNSHGSYSSLPDLDDSASASVGQRGSVYLMETSQHSQGPPSGPPHPQLGLHESVMNMSMFPVHNYIYGYGFPYNMQDKHHEREPSLFAPSECPTSEPATPTPSMAPHLGFAPHTHSFQQERMNTVLRQSIDAVINQKEDEFGPAMQKVKEVLCEKNGCNSLVDEIFKGIFNGESSMDYARLCKLLVDSPEPEVSLSIHEFTHFLLLKCRTTVTEPITTTALTYDMSQEEIDAIEESELRHRFRRTAAIKFSTDLYSKGIMPEALVHVCIQTMLFGRTIAGNETPPAELDEDNFATACRILCMVGEKMRDNSPVFLQRYCTVLESAIPSIISTRVKKKVRCVLSDFKDSKDPVDPVD